MRHRLLYPVGSTKAVEYAVRQLEKNHIQTIDHPSPDVTHLLLDTPSFLPDGMLRCGKSIESILEMLPDRITVIGGNLNHPALASCQCIDLLKNPSYIAQNASITAHCALRVAAEHLEAVYSGLPVLVIGWGKIGKCLAKLLRNLDASVTVLVRKEEDRALLEALGYQALLPEELEKTISQFRLIFNTAPNAVISRELSCKCQNCVKIELASQAGILSEDVITARGLPGTLAPVSSGKLIAVTLMDYFMEEA